MEFYTERFNQIVSLAENSKRPFEDLIRYTDKKGIERNAISEVFWTYLEENEWAEEMEPNKRMLKFYTSVLDTVDDVGRYMPEVETWDFLDFVKSLKRYPL